MRVKIKIGGVLHHTLTNMLVNDETRFSRLRSSPWSAWNLQKLLIYGLIRRTPIQREGDPDAIEEYYSACQRRAQGILKVKTPALDKMLGLDIGKKKRGQSYYARPKKNPLTRGVKSVKYTITKQGERVLRELNNCNTYYLTTQVSSNPRWKLYFIGKVW